MAEIKKLHVKVNRSNKHVSGDGVVVITGKYEGKRGKVLDVNPTTGKIIVEGVNIISKHRKPRSAREQGGIIKREGSIDSSNVMLYCSACNAPRKAEIQMHNDGNKIRRTRVCKKCKESFDK